jgi:glycosyltransferase involved in cell wall biosynthesis
MIVLYHLMLSKQEINSDSNYILASAFIRGMASIRPDWQFVIPFPDNRSGYKYDDDGFFRLRNVFRVPQRMSPRRMGNTLSYDASWYDQLFRKIGFDCIINMQVETAAQVSQSGQQTFADAGRPLSIASHVYVIHRSLPYLFDGMMEHVALSQCMGAYCSDYNVFDSDHCETMFFETAGEFLNAEKLESIRKRSEVIPLGTLESSLRYVERPRVEQPTIIYNHRLQTYKNYKDTLEILQKLWNEGLRFRVIVTSSSSENSSRVMHYPFVEFKLCATREDYLKVLRQGDLNVTNSQHETFCMSAVESMACGQCLIAPDAVTFPQITNKKENGYPYLFSDEADQMRILRKLIGSYEERTHWGRVLSRHVRQSYNRTKWADSYSSLVERLLSDGKYVPNTAEDVLEDMGKRLRLNNGIELKDFWNECAQRKINGRIPWGSQSLSYTKLVRLIRLLGGSVRIEDGECRVYS